MLSPRNLAGAPMYGKPPSGEQSATTTAAGASSGADDDMSLFLRHLLSSSSSSSSYPPAHLLSGDRGKDPIRYPFPWDPPPDAAAGRAQAESGEGDDYEWESEEGAEPAEEKAAAKPAPARSGPKRSRAAEVHNLSEKRRRSRINEKMKALQNLIPNSNKTDKASMLDEAIEYLKQLQLQVQMLSMRNGMSLHPMYMPGTMQSLQIPNFGNGFGTGDCPIQLNNLSIGSFPVGEERQTAHGLPNQPSPSLQPLVLPNTLDIRKSTATSGLDVSHTLQVPFQLPSSSMDLHGNESIPGPIHIDVHSRSKQTDKETNCLEGCMLEQTNLHLVGPNNTAQSEILIQQLDREEDARQFMGPK